jgi:hypothetical protein
MSHNPVLEGRAVRHFPAGTGMAFRGFSPFAVGIRSAASVLHASMAGQRDAGHDQLLKEPRLSGGERWPQRQSRLRFSEGAMLDK